MHSQRDKEYTDNQEMYIKAIYKLSLIHKVARVKDIAVELEVTKSSVSTALKHLAEKDLITYDPYSYVDLTDKGIAIAKRIVNKYGILVEFLQDVLLVPKVLAQENACRMEHVIDDVVMNRFVTFLDQSKKCESKCWHAESS
jgi:DtxR family Mn-dependent transcriptional regulator